MSEILSHYDRPELTARLRELLAEAFPDARRLTPADLAPLDQFHTRGILATAELAERAGISPAARVLDIGSGLGGPARYLAETYGCRVTGIDLSPGFVEAAQLLTERARLTDLATFEVGDATRLPYADRSFDYVTLHHVAMNVRDRRALYDGVYRVLRPGGTFVSYDVVRRTGDLLYPTPWARTSDASFVISAEETRDALVAAGFEIVSWHDETAIATAWFEATFAAQSPPSGLSLARFIGPEFAAMGANFRRNLSEGRAGIVSAIVKRP